jgi:hypothetical protein
METKKKLDYDDGLTIGRITQMDTDVKMLTGFLRNLKDVKLDYLNSGPMLDKMIDDVVKLNKSMIEKYILILQVYNDLSIVDIQNILKEQNMDYSLEE